MPTARELLLDALEERHKKYCAEAEHCQTAFSEQAVHDLRVSTRRLLALIILLKAVSPHPRLKTLHRSLKKQLDQLDDLRDTQVMLAGISAQVQNLPGLEAFHQYLARREERLLKKAARLLRQTKHKETIAISNRVGKIRASLQNPASLSESLTAPLLYAADEAFNEVKERIALINPTQPASIHRVRIKFKAFRYIIEIIHPLLPGFSKEQFKTMQAYQTSMGDIQDAEVLLRMLERYAKKHPEFEAQPILQFYHQQHHNLINTYIQNMGTLYTFWKPT